MGMGDFIFECSQLCNVPVIDLWPNNEGKGEHYSLVGRVDEIVLFIHGSIDFKLVEELFTFVTVSYKFFGLIAFQAPIGCGGGS